MNNLKIFCLCIHDELLEKVKKLNYIPVVLGEGNFKKGWLRDNTGKNISYKNKHYGEYSFHYWIWQNKMEIFNDISGSNSPYKSNVFAAKYSP